MNVYLSYSHSDAALAWKVADSLRKEGFQVWDDREMQPGKNWAEAMGNALRESEAMVILLTTAWLQSPHAQRDLEYALSERKFKGRLIPVVAGDIPIEEVPWVLREISHIQLLNLPDLKTNSEGLIRIGEVLNAVA
ncbi:MAG: toll/interleukin-1 receptor domain-containing protein [Cytophagaceae bacterium]|nr:toll/interleukin-1 receptor domain-containing protein [Cytophagaceae bacterium]